MNRPDVGNPPLGGQVGVSPQSPARPVVVPTPAASPASPPASPAQAFAGILPPLGPPAPLSAPVARSQRNRPLIAALAVLAVCVIGSALYLSTANVFGPSDAERVYASYQKQADGVVRDIEALDEELDTGMSYLEYGIVLDRANDGFLDLRAGMSSVSERSDSFIAIEAALDDYDAAHSAWGDYIDCTYYCSQDELDETLNDHWAAASNNVQDARLALEEDR